MFLDKFLILTKIKYWPTELKLTSLVWVMQKIWHFVKMTKNVTTFYTDHETALKLQNKLFYPHHLLITQFAFYSGIDLHSKIYYLFEIQIRQTAHCFWHFILPINQQLKNQVKKPIGRIFHNCFGWNKLRLFAKNHKK